MKQIKQKTEKIDKKKKIGNKLHTCIMGKTIDPNYIKCYLCARMEKVD